MLTQLLLEQGKLNIYKAHLEINPRNWSSNKTGVAASLHLTFFFDTLYENIPFAVIPRKSNIINEQQTS